MSARDVVIVTEPIADVAMTWLRERVDARFVSPDAEHFTAQLEQAAGLVVRTYTRVDEPLLGHAANLRVVGRAGVGYDNVDVDAARARGVEVVYAPGANTQAVVEFVLTILLGWIRPHPRVVSPMTAVSWRRLRRESIGARQLDGLTVGILGLGRVGGRLAEVVSALGARVIYNDLREIPADERRGAEPVSVSALFERSDVLSISVDGRASNRGFVGASLLDRMTPDALLINTSRGFVVDNAALATRLRRHRDAAALLDVHEAEPVEAGNPLLGLPNARLTPHLAGATLAAHEAMSWVVRDVVAVLEDRRPQHPVP